jgi:hypothetical protein
MHYTNKSTREPNNFVFENTKGQEYVFNANDQHHDTCPKHFNLKNDPSQTTNLHSKIQVKIGMLVILPFMMAYSMGLMGFFKMSPNYIIVNPSYGLFSIIQKQVLQLGCKINIYIQPKFQNIGHQYNQFLNRYKWVLIQAM